MLTKVFEINDFQFFITGLLELLFPFCHVQSEVTAVNQLSLICIFDLGENFTQVALSDPTPYFIWAGDKHRESQTWIKHSLHFFLFKKKRMRFFFVFFVYLRIKL